MSTLELSSIVLEIPNDAYTTLSLNLIGCSHKLKSISLWLFNTQSRLLQADWLNINMPYYPLPSIKHALYTDDDNVV